MSNPTLFRSHWWAVLFIVFFPFLIMNIYSDFIRESELNGRLGWLLLLGGMAYLLNRAPLQKILVAVLIIFALSGSLDIIYAITFGGVFVSATFEAIALTDTSEAFEFIQAYVSVENILALALYWSVTYYALSQLIIPAPKLTRQKIFAVLGILMMLAAIQQINNRGRTFDVIPGFAGVAIDYSSNHEAIEKVIDARKKLYENSPFKASLISKKAQTYVIVIGESLGRNHMALYGYGRNTTPELNRLKSDIIIFEDTISAFAQTKPSLSVNLTASDTLNKLPISQAISLVGAFKKAGFKTFWISNQQPLRVPTKPMAMIADEEHFISHDFHGVEVNRYDEFLLPSVKKAINDNAKHKVIFVHMMGSHLQYKNRYPESAIYYTDSNDLDTYQPSVSATQLSYINAYDDTVRYTDHFLGQVISDLKVTNQISGLTFWSDHGEEVFDTKDFKGHGPDRVTAPMLEVPFFFWRNEAYKNTFATSDALIATHTHSPLMMDDFFHFAQCLIPVNSELVNKNKSLCLEKYDAKPRMVYGKNYDTEIKPN